MQWSSEANTAIKKVPFFVRKKVRSKVEAYAAEKGKKSVGIEDVNAARKRFMDNMSSEVRGFSVDTCFGSGGCPNRAVESDGLIAAVESLLEKEDLLTFLRSQVKGEVKFHHEFRVTLADCPNACSQPQIKDIGIIGAAVPGVTDEPCSGCLACVTACHEDAVTVADEDAGPEIDRDRCVDCGKCVTACPTGTLEARKKGYRVLLGGKLGRHPRLARELPGIYDEATVLEIVGKCLTHYKARSKKGARFAEIVWAEGDELFDRLGKMFESRQL
ncbi:MAG: 4Fe-4S dicluster domain-containing protein [Deltaproteobacteria bacterium]|nr:4Fe-4S dicluster domain-containing protein [Deltaproteobacteria bacterium]